MRFILNSYNFLLQRISNYAPRSPLCFHRDEETPFLSSSLFVPESFICNQSPPFVCYSLVPFYLFCGTYVSLIIANSVIEIWIVGNIYAIRILICSYKVSNLWLLLTPPFNHTMYFWWICLIALASLIKNLWRSYI